jgi:23S rRNA (pseudouridine1915-N3)-methyltransferase
MHLRLLAVGDRQPGWVDAAVDSYVSRLPREWKFRVEVLPAAKRSRKDPGRAVDDEATALLGRLSPAEHVILLDERGRQLTSPELAKRVSAWQGMGRDLCFIIGGPDGVAAAVRERADFCWSLSALTLPHGLARVTAVEQLYRAWSLNAGHPYHRS